MRELQIDVKGQLQDQPDIMDCRLYVDGRCCTFYMSKANYEALLYDKVFLRKGDQKDSAGMINTTNTFIEKRH